MPISIYAGVREHEGKSDPHRQYLRSEDARKAYALKSELDSRLRAIALTVRPLAEKVNSGVPSGKGEKGPKGDKGDQGDPGAPGGAPHTHPISEVVSLQTALDSKAASAHSHAIGDVTNLQSSLNGKANTSHTHAIGDVTNLQSTLDGKAASSHAHAQSDVTGLPAALAGKANTSHTHPQSEVVNLVTDLAAKAALNHTHAGLPVMGRIAADISQSSNVTFSNLFTQAVLTGEVWSFDAVIFFTSAAVTTGLVTQCDSPAAPTFGQCSLHVQETVTVGRYLPAAFNAVMIGTAAVIAPAINTARLTGTLEVGVNAGNLVIKFRSEVNGSAVVVKRGSLVRFYKH